MRLGMGLAALSRRRGGGEYVPPGEAAFTHTFTSTVSHIPVVNNGFTSEVLSDQSAVDGAFTRVYVQTGSQRTLWSLAGFPTVEADFDALLRMRGVITGSPTSRAQLHEFVFRSRLVNGNHQGYRLNTDRQSDNDDLRLELRRWTGSGTGSTELATVRTVPYGEWFYARVNMVGNVIRAKAWSANTSEPTAWDTEITDTTWTQPGNFLFGRPTAFQDMSLFLGDYDYLALSENPAVPAPLP
jgi:hypothetical protein